MKSDGSIWAWGSNWHGQIGNGTRIDSNVPIQISTGSINSVLEAGYYNSILLKHINNHPPVAICKDITVYLTNKGTVEIKYTDIDNGSFDNAGIVSWVVIPNIFDCNMIGQNWVNLIVTDQSGNQSSCWSIVTVMEDLKPRARCRNIDVNLNIEGWAQISPLDVDDGSLDNCGIYYWTVTPNYFTADNPGRNTVTLTVSDFSGNIDNCLARVRILPYQQKKGDVSYAVSGEYGTINIYPNPAEDFVMINGTLPEKTDIEIALYTILGEQVTVINLKNKSEIMERINIEGLLAGMYIIELRFDGNFVQKRIIKK